MKFLRILALVAFILFWGNTVRGQTTSQTFNSSGTFIVPPGVTSITVEAWGGGGGGSGRNGSAGGGGGAAYTMGVLTGLTPGSLTVTVGTGGGVGTNGNASSIGAIIANGGLSTNSRNGGAGGLAIAIGGDVTASYAGGNGGTAPTNSGGGNNENGGGGGGSAFTNANGNNGTGSGNSGTIPSPGGTGTGNGGQGACRDGNPDATAGSAPGGGGGGRGEGGGTSKAGADGRIIISWVPAYRAQFTAMDIGSNIWFAGETRTVTVTVTNTGQATWTDAAPDINIGVKWNADADYFVRENAGNLAPGASHTYPINITAPVTAGTNNLTFDVVSEGNCWFADNSGACGPGNSVYTSGNITIVPVYSPGYRYTSSGTFTVLPGITSIKVECWGGGGGGSSITDATSRRGGGGGGGAYSSSIVMVVPGNTYSVTVGTGGTAGTAGVASSFGSGLVVAAGGSGGTNNTVTRGLGGTIAASTGTLEFRGGNGANGDVTANYSGGGGGGAGSNNSGGDATGSTAGTGTSVYGGNGGMGVNGSVNGQAGSFFGGGGSGAVTNSATTRTGGPGAGGLVIITLPANLVLSSNNQVPDANVYQGTVKHPIFSFETGVTNSNALLTDLSVTTAGTYTGTDVIRFQLWYNTSNNFATAVQLGGNITTGLGTGLHIFSGLNQVIHAGTSGYFWITADIANTATASATLSVNAVSPSNLTFELTPIYTGSTTNGGTQTILAAPRVNLADAGQVTAANVTQGTVGHQLYRFTTAITTANATLNSLSFVTAGTYAAIDVLNFKLWYNTSNDFSSASQIGSQIIGSLGTGTHTFSGLDVTTNAGTTGYFWITTDIAPFPTNGRTIQVNAITTGSLSYSTIVFSSGTASNAGAQTITTTNGIILSSTFPAVSANSVLQGSTNQTVFKFITLVAGTAVTINSVSFTTSVSSTYVGSDLVNFKLFYNTVNSLVSATQISSNTTGLGPGTHTFAGLTQGTAANTRGYFWITADIALTAGPGHTLTVDPVTTANLTYSGTPNKNGSTYAGGIQTIQTKLDIDGDDVGDVYDLDDDNDGIPDYNENLPCNTAVAELFPNSNFDAGNTGFYSGYGYVTIVNQTSLYPEGIYAITPNANLGHNAFAECTGHGNMMVVNGSSNPNLIVWSSGTIAVTPNTDYTLTINLTSVNPGNPAQLIFNVNGENIGLQFNATTTNCEWVPGIAIWNSGSNTSATFDILNLNLAPGGNDFAIDDISCKYKIDCDSDGDGVPDRMDLDSDNDGIYDVVEAGGTATVNGTISGYADLDLDGLSDNVDDRSSGSGGTDIFNGTPLPNPDTDTDSYPNVIDRESDGDGCRDVIEAGFTDGDNDGILGSSPVTVNSEGVVTSASGYTLPDDDNSDGIRDYVQRLPLITVQPVNRSICTTSGTGTTFPVTATNTGGTYQWQVSTNGGGSWANVTNGGVYSNAATSTLTISSAVTSAYDGYLYRLLLSNNAFKCSPLISDSATLRVSGSSPVLSGSISGDAVVCPNATGLIYSISAVPSAISYTWTAPAGWTIQSGQTTNAITVSSGATGGNITVTASNACGTGAPVSLATSINTPSPTFTAPVSGSACQSADVTYTTQSGKINYIWTISGTAGVDYTITSGGTSTDNTLVVKWLTTGSKTVTVNYTGGGCQGITPASKIITVDANAIIMNQPAIPPPICAGTGVITIGITASGTISGYQWQVSTDGGTSWSDLGNIPPYSNTGTNTLTITNPAAGLDNARYHCVVTGSCGAVTSNSATLTVNPAPAIPGAITGTATQCPGLTLQGYSITAVPNATTYTWTLPAGWTITAGTGTTGITVTTGAAGQNGNITVTAGNSCGTSAASTLAVTVNPIPVIANKTTSVYSGLSFTVTPVSGTDIVPAGTTYSWPLPVVTGGITGGATGTGAANISGTLVNPGNTAGTATYTITPTASGCPGNSFTVTVTVNAIPVISGMLATVCSGAAFSLTPVNGTNGIVPAGTTYSWPAPVVTGGMTGGSTGTDAASISGTLSNPTTGVQTATYTVTPKTGTYSGSTFTMTITVNPVASIGPMTESVCSGTTFTVTPANGTDGTIPGGTTYNWPVPSVSGGITGGVSGTNANSIGGTLVNPTSSTQTATYTITPVSGTCSGNSFPLTVTINALPVVSITSETTVCEGTTITLEAGMGFAGYEWRSGATVIGNQHSQDITTGVVSSATPVTETYSVTVTDSNGCESGDSQSISVYHKPETGPGYTVPNNFNQ